MWRFGQIGPLVTLMLATAALLNLLLFAGVIYIENRNHFEHKLRTEMDEIALWSHYSLLDLKENRPLRWDELAHLDDISQVCLVTAQQMVYRMNSRESCPMGPATDRGHDGTWATIRHRDVGKHGMVATVSVAWTGALGRHERSATLAAFLGALAIQAAVLGFLLPWFRENVSRPLQNTLLQMRKVAQTRDYTIRVDENGITDVRELAMQCNRVLDSVEAAEQHLVQLNFSLRHEADEQKLLGRQLQRAHESLIEAEKMAAVGQLVAGVAHEVSSPLSNALVAASWLEEDDWSDADPLLQAKIGKTLPIISKNLQRAIRLLQSMRGIVADERTHDIRNFDAEEYIGEVLATLDPQIRRSPHSLDWSVTERMTLHGDPSALAQIVNNLVLNAITHAFPEGVAGEMTLRLEADGEQHCRLVFTDNGRGMSSTERQRAFEPFFTTRRASGGTGLGLYLVAQIVRSQLSGELELKPASSSGGTCFSIRFPRDFCPESQDAPLT